MGPLLTARELGELLGLSPTSVLRRWRAGEIPGFVLSSNVVRFDRAEIDQWLATRRQGPILQTDRSTSSTKKEIARPAEQRGSAYRTRSGWGVRWYESGQRRFRSGFASKSAALAYFRDEVVHDAGMVRADLTLAEFAERFLAAHAAEVDSRTIRSLRERLRRPLAEFGERPLDVSAGASPTSPPGRRRSRPGTGRRSSVRSRRSSTAQSHGR